MRSLDVEQERIARQIRPGHCILAAIAGFGKTQILIARSKWLYQKDPAARILVTCYNVCLAGYLRSLLGVSVDGMTSQNNNVDRHGRQSSLYASVEVKHFHRWAGNRVPLPSRYTTNEAKLDKTLAESVL